jgi:AcrR family transcriptional regulator
MAYGLRRRGADKGEIVGQLVTQRRRYDSPLRRQRAAQTRERIVAAGWELAHECPVWDWRALTVRAVAKRADVNERTVYRHFPSERELRDAVMQRLEEEAGVTLEGLRLQDVADVAARVFAHVSSFPLASRTPRDATLRAADQRRREALLHAVASPAAGWPETDRKMAAAILDVLWSVTSYERLLAGWELAPGEATRAITWAMGLIEAAIQEGRPPANARPAPSR